MNALFHFAALTLVITDRADVRARDERDDTERDERS
jgi:hypothetical protein